MNEKEETFPIDIERLLAAFLKNSGKVEIQIADILSDYSNYKIAVEQTDDETRLSFELVKSNGS